MSPRQNARASDVLLYILQMLKGYYPYVVAALAVLVSVVLRIPDEILFGVALAALFGSLVYYRFRDARRIRQRTYEAMSPELRTEIDQERKVNLEKKRKFLDAMSKASGGKPA